MTDPWPVTLQSRVSRNDEVPWKTLDDTVVVLDLNSGDFFELDEVGGRIWTALDGRNTLEEHALSLVERYNVDESTARSDVMAFVSELGAMGLLVRAG